MKKRITLAAITLFTSISVWAQFDGTFSSGNTFELNHWTVANDDRNAWYIGTLGANGASLGAYISNDNGVSNTYVGEEYQYSHLYTTVNFPLGKTDIDLDFDWRANGQFSWDGLTVFLVPVGTPIVAGEAINDSYKIGYEIFTGQTSFQSQSIQLDANLAGSSRILVFSWENDNSWNVYQPPASIDNVVLHCNYELAPIQTAMMGDTIRLNVTGFEGSVQWQEGLDTTNWTDIPGFTHATESFCITSITALQKYYRAKIVDSNCLPHSPFYSSIIRLRFLNNASELQIGDWYKGGIVFSHDGAGNGLVALPQNQSEDVPWGCNGVLLGATDGNTGQANTNLIVSSCQERPIAASICVDFESEGFDDWYLPAKNQLITLYAQKDIVGNFDEYGVWWSSTEMYNEAAYIHIENNGLGKISTDAHTRCIRSFASNQKVIYAEAIAPNPYYSAQITEQPQSDHVCLGEAITLNCSASGSAPITFQWYRDGNPIQNTGSLFISDAQLANQGLYQCVVSNTCGTFTSQAAQINVVKHELTVDQDIRICRGQQTQSHLNCSSNHVGASGSFSVNWTPSSGLSASNVLNPNINALSSTNYFVQISDEAGCISEIDVPVTVGEPYEDQEISLVTVDDVSGRNKVIWNKTENVGTDYYVIYKETGANDFTYSGYVTSTQPAEYIDIFSQPDSYANRYKILCIDTCGNESTLSYSHKTINLTLSSFGNTMGLQWNDYIDESGVFVPSWFYIFRGTTANDMQIIDSVSGGVGSYNDINVYENYIYKIGVKRNNTLYRDGSTIFSFSNAKDNSSLLGVNQINAEQSIRIYPNPMKDKALVQIKSNLSNSDIEIEIMDALGKILKHYTSEHLTQTQSSYWELEIDRNELKAGMYSIVVKADKVYRSSLVVE